MTSTAASDNNEENSVPGLWETARYFFQWLVSICGDPCALVGEGWLSRKERREILHWLRPVEAIVRRLLVAEAARIAQTLPPAQKRAFGKARRPAPRAPFCRVSFPNPENSAGWPVRFSVCGESGSFRSAPAARARRISPRIRSLETHADVLALAALAHSAAQFRMQQAQTGPEHALPHLTAGRPKTSRAAGNPWRLARRIEAVARVLENPQAFARRLARRLHKDAARLTEACRPPPPREPGQRPRYGEEPVRHASEFALAALAVFDSS